MSNGPPPAAAPTAVTSLLLVFPRVALTRAGPSASEDAGDRNHEDAVALYGLTEHAADGEGIPSLLQDFVWFHPSSIRRAPQATATPGWAYQRQQAVVDAARLALRNASIVAVAGAQDAVRSLTDARLAPSVIDSNFAHTIGGTTQNGPATVPNPQSLPAIKLPAPTLSA